MIQMIDLTRELAAVIKVACTMCHAPAGSHCANYIVAIVWPPHLCRMDAYTHRLDESEDWPIPDELPVLNELQYVENKQPDKPLLWKNTIALQLLKPNPDIHEE